MKNYLIKSYSIDSLAIDISDFTNTPLSYVLEKPFTGYLDAYLGNWKDDKIDSRDGFGLSVVLERDYIDSSYLDDFANYYSKNFGDYGRKCLRIHFFRLIDTETTKIYDYTISDLEIKKLKDNYLGFLVIRPIPQYFVSKACFKLWDSQNNEDHICLTKKIESSLCGITFNIETIPFTEQDHILSVCATSALWTFFYTNKFVSKEALKSPYAISKTALLQNDVYTQDNHTPGYSLSMICECIEDNHLSPLLFDTQNLLNSDIKDIIHTFVKSKYPVVLGLTVYGSDGNEKGLHAVTVLGDNYKESKFYIHDDRIGFYAALDEEKNNFWKLSYSNSVSKILPKPEDEYYKITDIVTGLYHKIRLPLSTVRQFSNSFKQEINSCLPFEVEQLSFEIFIKESNQLKEEVRKNFSSYKNAEELLNMHLPRFLWISNFSYQDKVCFSCLFDATEVSQGNILIFILEISEAYGFLALIPELYKNYENKMANSIPLKEVMNEKLFPFYTYYRTKTNNHILIYENLDKLFGVAKSPKYIKSHEYIADEIRQQNSYCFTTRKDSNIFQFDKTIPYYLWIIDEEGYLYIGTEENKNGHPTLINGRKGRIGGELHHSEKDGKCIWSINSKSGRYSWDDSIFSKKNIHNYLVNALNERFNIYFPTMNITIEEDF